MPPSQEKNQSGRFTLVETWTSRADSVYTGGILGIYSSYAYPYSSNCVNVPEKDGIVLKGSDMALYAVFQNLGLRVNIRPVMPDVTTFFETDKYDTEEDLAPLVGRWRPGQLVITDRGGSDGDNPREWAGEVFEQRPDVTWITDYKWQGLGLIHLTVCRPSLRFGKTKQVY